ncbi:hypothetical protein [Halalkalibacter oceani]|uniref:hypothetical protein n=1 Tax=Halalkalibacter oceani TaxID=1653776 RepID=UPI00339A9001
MFKFNSIGAIEKHVRNNPRNIATSTLQNGMSVIMNDQAGTASVPATATEAQGLTWIVGNIIDKPEVRNNKEFTIENGEHVRGFLAEDAKELQVEVDYRVVATDLDTVSIGDHLVVANAADHGEDAGKWIKPDGTVIADSSSYNTYLEVLKKTTYGDKGLLCKVVKN